LVSVVDGKSNLVHVPNDVVSFDGGFLLLHDLSLFIRNDTESTWLGLKVFVAVGIDLEADVVNFKSTGIPSSEVGRKRRLDTSESERNVCPGCQHSPGA
jgi:hypothetical protein